MADLCPYCGAKLPTTGDAFCPECRGDLTEAPPKPQSYAGHEPIQESQDTLAANLWHATEERLFRWMKVSWYDDRGVIEATPRGLLFRGQKGRFVMSRITTVHVDGPVIPWAAIASLVIGNIFVLLMARAGAFTYLTLEKPITYLLLLGLDLFAIASWPMNWVRVDYSGEDGLPRRAYFTAASMLERWTRGPKHLCALLADAAREEGRSKGSHP